MRHGAPSQRQVPRHELSAAALAHGRRRSMADGAPFPFSLWGIIDRSRHGQQGRLGVWSVKHGARSTGHGAWSATMGLWLPRLMLVIDTDNGGILATVSLMICSMQFNAHNLSTWSNVDSSSALVVLAVSLHFSSLSLVAAPAVLSVDAFTN